MLRLKQLSKLSSRNFSLLHMLSDPVVTSSIGALGAIVVTSFAMSRYKVSKPNQYISVCGIGISDIKISKKIIHWPFQKYDYIQMNPKNYSFNLQAMSNQKMEFVLPGVFTIGPKDDMESLKKYCRYLTDKEEENHDDRLDGLVKGIIEGETRVLAAQMTIEEIFNDRATFKKQIIENVQSELEQFGLFIFNANIKELQDAPGSEYFTYMRQKARSEAESQAKIDISEAQKKAIIGEKQRETDGRQSTSVLEAETVKIENTAKQSIVESQARLEIIKTNTQRDIDIKKIEAANAKKLRDSELNTEVEKKKALEEVETKRAKDLSFAQVDAEIKIKQSSGIRDSLVISSEGEQKSMEILANASLFKAQAEATGIYATMEAKARGTREQALAEAEGIRKLVEAIGGNPESLVKYLMINKGIYTDVAKSNADAIRGLCPKITVYSNDGKHSDPLGNIMSMIPSMLGHMDETIGKKLGSIVGDALKIKDDR